MPSLSPDPLPAALPLFSIVSVTYNNLAGLHRTAQSVAAQSCRDFEWIVIDGGSEDGSARFLEDFSFENGGSFEDRESFKNRAASPALPGYFWISEPDAGIYDAMNKGLARARGRYTIFMNAGDCLASPRTLGLVAAALALEKKDRAVDFIYGDSLESDGKSPAIHKVSRPSSALAYGMFTHHQSMIYRTERLLSLSPRYDQNYDISADYDLTCRFLCGAQETLYIPRPLCLFEAGGISQRRTARGRRQQYQIRRRLGLCNPIENAFIFLIQSASLFLRRLAPDSYWRLRHYAMTMARWRWQRRSISGSSPVGQ